MSFFSPFLFFGLHRRRSIGMYLCMYKQKYFDRTLLPAQLLPPWLEAPFLRLRGCEDAVAIRVCFQKMAISPFSKHFDQKKKGKWEKKAHSRKLKRWLACSCAPQFVSYFFEYFVFQHFLNFCFKFYLLRNFLIFSSFPI